MGIQALRVGDDGTVIFTNALKLPADTEVGGSAVVALGTITSVSATAFAVGRQGATTPVLNVNAATASVVTGITLVGAAAAAGMAIIVTSSGTNESLTIDAKGSGTILLNGTATGAVLVGDATNPALSVVHTSEGTGFKVTSAAAASGVALAAISSGTDESMTLDAKGAGTLTINGTATGAVILGRVARVKSITVPVAAAGTTVANAAALGAANIVHITSDGATKGVKMLPAVLGDFQFIVNDSATACEFYANDGGTVNGLSADASVVIPASKGLFVQATAADTLIAFDLPAKATAS